MTRETAGRLGGHRRRPFVPIGAGHSRDRDPAILQQAQEIRDRRTPASGPSTSVPPQIRTGNTSAISTSEPIETNCSRRSDGRMRSARPAPAYGSSARDGGPESLWAGRSTPTCRRRTQDVPARRRRAGSQYFPPRTCVDPARARSRVPRSRADAMPRPRWRSTPRPLRARMRSSRCIGWLGSSGRYAAPAFKIPSSATISSGVRFSDTPMSAAGPPQGACPPGGEERSDSRGDPASAAARCRTAADDAPTGSEPPSSARYVSSPSVASTATASGVRAACSRRARGRRVARDAGRVVPLGEHLRVSASRSIGSAPTHRCGSSIVPSNATRR